MSIFFPIYKASKIEGIPQADGDVAASGDDDIDAKKIEEAVKNLQVGDQSWTPDVSKISEKADILVAYSTVPGNHSAVS